MSITGSYNTTLSFFYRLSFKYITANSVFMTDAPPPYPGIYGAWSPPQGAGAMATAPTQMNGSTSSADAKAAEAAASGTVQTGYYDPTNPQTAYIPPGTVSI